MKQLLKCVSTCIIRTLTKVLLKPLILRTLADIPVLTSRPITSSEAKSIAVRNHAKLSRAPKLSPGPTRATIRGGKVWKVKSERY
eukprot:835725-Pleurochrysis_carterae.AAC.4